MIKGIMLFNGSAASRRRVPAAGMLLLAAAAALLAGCGGSGGGVAGPGRSAGSLAVGIQWPAPGRLVPAGSNSILAVLKAADGTAIGQQLAVRPSAPPWNSTVTFTGIEASSVVLSATAFPGADGSGVAQAAGTVTAAIAPNQQTKVTLTMASTIDHLTVTPPSPAVQVGAGVQLTATAYDSSGSVVLTTPGKITWSVDNKALASVDATGKVTAVAAGMPKITATDTESNISGSDTVTITSSHAMHGPSFAALMPNQNYYYVANSLSKDIHIFSVNAGALTPILAPVSLGKYPFGMTIANAGAGYYLYVLACDNPSKGGAGNAVVLQWAINGDGSLTPLSPASVPAISAPVALFTAFTDTGNFVYDIDAHNGIRSFSIGANGALSPIGSDLTPGQYLGSYAFQNGSNYLLGTPGGGVASFNILTDGSVVRTHTQLSILAEEMSTSGVSPYLFVGNDSGITPYFEANDGSLNPTGTGSNSSLLGNASVVNNSGSFLYAIGNFGGNNVVSQFGISSADGSLRALSPATVPAGNSPSTITLAFSGLYLYITNSGDDTISQYFVGLSGYLTPMSPATVAD